MTIENLDARRADSGIVVLKFGSSVLVDRGSLPEVVSEIYRVVRSGKRVVAVTSAFLGVTDALLSEASATGCTHDNVNAAAYIATGEETSAALVALACDRSGLCATALKSPELGILADGPDLDATPVGLNSIKLWRALDGFDVVVVPGFVATNPRGGTVLLGRGGSDLSAVFLADALGAERVRLVKDVDGVYDSDPAKSRSAQRFHHLDWASAAKVAGKLIQERALNYAAERGVDLEVGAIGADEATLVGAARHAAAPRRPQRKLRVALAGYGVVGAGVAERIAKRPEAFEIVSVLVRDAGKLRAGVSPALFTDDADAFLASEPDVVVDAISSGVDGKLLCLRALEAGCHVLSANKQAIVAGYADLTRAAQRRGVSLSYSAAVGGAAPLLETVAQAVADGCRILEIEGVFNGTVNYLLEKLADGASFEEALQAAQRAGLAEEDPSADLSGADAAAKLNLVSLAAFGAAPHAANLTIAAFDARIAETARKTRLKQIARIAQRGRALHASIAYEPADAGPFADLRGDRNGVRLTALDGRVWSARGRGAGRWPTTESVFADLVDLSAAWRASAQSAARTAATLAAVG